MSKTSRLINRINRYSLSHMKAGHYSKIGRFLLNKSRSILLGYPHHLMIEPTLRCNIRCPLCPSPQDLNPRRFQYDRMSMPDFRKIISNSKDVIYRLHLTTFGEPLLNPDLHHMIRHLTDHGLISMVSTNATLLTKKRADQLIAAGLDYLIVSFDGFSPQSYETFREGAKFEKTLANLSALNLSKVSKRSVKPYVDIQWIRNRLNEKEINQGRKYFQQMRAIDEFHVKSLSLNEHIMNSQAVKELGERFLPEKGKIRVQYMAGETNKKEKKGCSEVLSPVVMANGDVTICCMDFRGEYIVGNVAEKTFKELWHSPPYKFMREKANSFRLPLCKKCPTRYR